MFQEKPAGWFLTVAIGSALIALLMVPSLEFVLHESLPLILHIPIAAVILALLASGGLVAGVAYAEYRARLARSENEA